MLTNEDDFAELENHCRLLDEAEQANGAALVEAMLAATCFFVAIVFALLL